MDLLRLKIDFPQMSEQSVDEEKRHGTVLAEAQIDQAGVSRRL